MISASLTANVWPEDINRFYFFFFTNFLSSDFENFRGIATWKAIFAFLGPPKWTTKLQEIEEMEKKFYTAHFLWNILIFPYTFLNYTYEIWFNSMPNFWDFLWYNNQNGTEIAIMDPSTDKVKYR